MTFQNVAASVAYPRGRLPSTTDGWVHDVFKTFNYPTAKVLRYVRASDTVLALFKTIARRSLLTFEVESTARKDPIGSSRSAIRPLRMGSRASETGAILVINKEQAFRARISAIVLALMRLDCDEWV